MPMASDEAVVHMFMNSPPPALSDLHDIDSPKVEEVVINPCEEGTSQ